MLEPVLPAHDSAARAIAQQGFLLMPGLLDRRGASLLAVSARVLPARRVICGIPNVSWDEQPLSAPHVLHDLFTRAATFEFVEHGLGRAVTRTPMCWTSCYSTSEYINEHRDASGDIQFLLCIEAPPPGHGGSLKFGDGGTLGEVLLTPGDGVLFLASKLIHATTPMVASETVPAPRRVVAVARYFAVDP